MNTGLFRTARNGFPTGLAILFVIALCLFVSSASAETKLMVVSDLHYLEPSLYQGSGFFLRARRGGDMRRKRRGGVLPLHRGTAQGVRIE